MTGTVTVVPGGPPQAMPVSGAAVTTSAPSTGNYVPKASTFSTYQLVSAAAAACVIEASNEDPNVAAPANWVALGTITLAAAGSDGFVTMSNWRYVRARVTSASAATRVWQGV